MKIKGQKITITQGDSFDIPFKLVADEGCLVTHFEKDDKIVWVLNEYGDHHCHKILKEITDIEGAEFNVYVSKEESQKICPGRYEYGVFVENGNNRLTLIKPTDFVVERGV